MFIFPSTEHEINKKRGIRGVRHFESFCLARTQKETPLRGGFDLNRIFIYDPTGKTNLE